MHEKHQNILDLRFRVCSPLATWLRLNQKLGLAIIKMYAPIKNLGTRTKLVTAEKKTRTYPNLLTVSLFAVSLGQQQHFFVCYGLSTSQHCMYIWEECTTWIPFVVKWPAIHAFMWNLLQHEIHKICLVSCWLFFNTVANWLKAVWLNSRHNFYFCQQVQFCERCVCQTANCPCNCISGAPVPSRHSKCAWVLIELNIMPQIYGDNNQKSSHFIRD